MVTVEDLMEYPPPKRILWKEWSNSLTDFEKKIIGWMRNDFKKELKNHNINLEIVVQPVPIGEAIWGDYSSDLMTQKYGYDSNESYIVFELIYRPDNFHFESFLESGLFFKHHLKNNKRRKMVYDIFKEYFGDMVMWDKSDNKTIHLNFRHF